MLFNLTTQDRMEIFERILLFKAMNNAKTNRLAVASWILLEGKGHKIRLIVSKDESVQKLSP